ncbi:MAG: hypothetical protein ACRD0Y_04495 [Terriglobales bacterium]
MNQHQPVSRAEAAGALQEISTAQQRSKRLYGYQKASPHLIMWGIIWVIGYGTSPWPNFGWIWIVLVIAGLAGSFRIAMQQRRQASAHAQATGREAGRYIAGVIAVTAFLIALFAITQPHTDLQAEAVMPLLVAIAYVLHGIFASGTRMWATGLAIGVLTVAGFLWTPQYFLLWMAAAGGGGMILGGLWLRNA